MRDSRLLTLTAVLPILALTATTSAREVLEPATEVLVTGTVTDARTGAALPGAQVMVERTTTGAPTGNDGAYRLTVPAAAGGGEIVLRAALIGYQQATRRVRLPAGADSLRIDFRLHPAEIAMEDLVVTGASAAAADRAVEFRAREFRAMSPAHPGWPPPGYNREGYAHIEENGFLSARGNPLSTFAVDVDRASYANMRRFITNGQRPPRDAVRIEELVNYFDYAYAEPEGDAPFSISTRLIRAPWQPAHYLLRIGLKAPSVEVEDLPPSNLVFLLDVSGSMRSPDKLPLVKRSLGLLVDQLREEDRVAIVVYAGASGLVLESTPGDRKAEIRAAIARLEAGGSTAGAAGIRLAYDVAHRNRIRGGNNRVILATDGDFNVGVSSESELVQLIEKERESGIFLTVLGFGTGNLQDAKMEALANHGNGNYAYVDRLSEARKVLVAEMGGTLLTVARDVKVQVEFNPERVAGYRLIGYENRLLAAEDFDDDEKDAGEIGAGHAVTALYEVVPVGAESDVELREPPELRYSERPETTSSSDELVFVKLRYKEPDGDESRLLLHAVADRLDRADDDTRFAAAVAAFGMLLRDSEHAGSATLARVLELAEPSADRDEHRSEFLELVRAVQSREILAMEPR